MVYKSIKPHAKQQLACADLGPATVVSFTIHEGLQWTYSPGTTTHQYDQSPGFPPHVTAVKHADSPCACLFPPLLAFLSPTEELLKICFREHLCKMAEAVMKSSSSLENISIFLFYFPEFFSFSQLLFLLLFLFSFSQLLLPKSKQAVSTCALKIMIPQVALPSWKKEFCCLRQSARKDQAPVY